MADPLHRALGLTDDEASDIERLLGRAPNHLELAMYAVMWSEHCSYKSSRLHLRRLPSMAPWVIVGPGEGAGVVDVGDGIAAALRIESHNHPSAIEPFQGAATGVGGIIRDIFSMGARPIALMDPLRFGPLDDPRSRWIAEGVVSGISHYGNAVGVPTVGGEVVTDATYQGNPLVNVLCLGVLPVERLVLGRASGAGNLAVLLGSSTGRDGIGGVSVLASAGFSEDGADAAKRPSVQVGDPFEEKRLIEACLALLDAGLVVGIQDLGGAGITCATSESQERMLAIVEPESLDDVLAICERWEVQASVIGRVTEGGRLRVVDGWGGEVLADLPAASLHDAAPCYDRPRQERRRSEGQIDPASLAPDGDPGADLLAMLMGTEWISRQYDHMLFLNTVEGPGGDATVLRLKHPTTGADTGRGLAITTDGNHRWCAVDPRRGTARVVAEAVLNLACVGARPLALVNCLNFGNPEHPAVMWELSEAVDGMADVCAAFELPVIGGNVSLYNETQGRDIDPTPIVGVLGVVEPLDRRPPGVTLLDGGELLLLGGMADQDPLAGSRWAWSRGARGGTLEALDAVRHRAVAELVRGLVTDDLLAGVHDVADGGLALTVGEMVARSRVGAVLTGIDGISGLFGEGPSRVVVCCSPADAAAIRDRAAATRVPLRWLGRAGGDRLTIANADGSSLVDLAVADVVARYTNALPDAFDVAARH